MNKLTTSSFAGKNGLRTLKLAWCFSFLDLTTLNYEFLKWKAKHAGITHESQTKSPTRGRVH